MENGWIFPDGTKYDCGLDIHDRIVKIFIEKLKFYDETIYNQIAKEIDELFWEHGAKNLYSNYAITRLGWIKVGTSVWHNVKYAGYDWQQEFVEQYKENGYHVDCFYDSENNYLKLQYDVLKVIRTG